MDAKTHEKEKTIAYRLGRPYTDKLDEAADLHGMSRGQYARLVLVTHFEDTALHRLGDEIRDLRKEVTEIRIDRVLQAQRRRVE